MTAKKSPVNVLKEKKISMDVNAVFAYHQELLSDSIDNDIQCAVIELAIQAMARDIKKRFKNGDAIALEQAKRFITFTKKIKGFDNLHKMGGFAYSLIRKNDCEQVLKMARELRLFYEQTLSNTFPKKQ